MLAFYQLDWIQFYERFPEFASRETWHRVMTWSSEYGTPALLLIAVSPLPQTPAQIFFGIAHHDPLSVFVSHADRKLLKYGLFAWLVVRFPERFANGLGGLLRSRSKIKNL